MIKTLALLVALALSTIAISGCSTLNHAAENPVFVRIAVTQATLRYIEAGDTAAEVAERREDFTNGMEYLLTLTDPAANATVDTIFRTFLQQLPWDDMRASDKALAMESFGLVQSFLSARVRSGELESDTVVLLRSIVLNAIDAARYL